jgi:hypothetical protein
MRLDNVILRPFSILGPEWWLAYALIDLHPGTDIDKFQLEIPNRLTYHHETEKYLGGVPGDIFVGFYARAQEELFQEMAKVRTMEEVREVKDWAIVNFPANNVELTRLDWRIIQSLRGDATKTSEVIANELGEDRENVEKRLEHIKAIPLCFSIEPPNNNEWAFGEIHLDFFGTTLEEKREELATIGKVFSATTSRFQGVLMVEPESLEELKEMIKKASLIPGVKVVDYAFCEDMLWTQPWLDAFIEEQIAIA